MVCVLVGCAGGSTGGDDDDTPSGEVDAAPGAPDTGGDDPGPGPGPGAPDAGGGDPGPGPGAADAGFEPGDGTAVDPEYAPRLAQAYCERVFACCTADELALFEVMPSLGPPPAVTTEAQCRAHIQAFIEALNVLGVLKPFIDAGEIVYDEARRDACNAALAAMACTEFNKHTLLIATGGHCLPIRGTIEDGGACVLAQACKSGYCGGAGTCGPRPGVGQACAGECADGAWCDAGTCAAKEPNGSACGRDEECVSEFCDEIYGPGDGVCADITYCDGL